MSFNSSTNVEKISSYTIEEFNKLLEDNKPFTKNTFKAIKSNNIETLENTLLDYNIDLKILICSKCNISLDNKSNIIIKHFKVSTLLLLFKVI